MNEHLERGELPIQAVYEREDSVTATVPVHLAIMDLPGSVRTDASLIADARDVVRQWYNDDMERYLEVLASSGYEIPWLQGYERFLDDWVLGGTPNGDGFLSLEWQNGGDTHRLQLNKTPVVLHNQHDGRGEFYKPESSKGLVEVFYRSVTGPEIVFMSPEKMRKYGKETERFRIQEDHGIAEVVGRAFSSDYLMNMAETLLLRDFGVFYLNRLLDRV